MLLTDRRTPETDPLLPHAALLPLSDPGGVRYTTPTEPGELRPFAATLGVPRPMTGKHNTTTTSETKNTNSQTSKDGVVVNDTLSDVSSDS